MRTFTAFPFFSNYSAREFRKTQPLDVLSPIQKQRRKAQNRQVIDSLMQSHLHF